MNEPEKKHKFRRLRRSCKKCSEMFEPTSKFQRYCEPCLDERYFKRSSTTVYPNILKKKVVGLPRHCLNCGSRFQPTGRHNRVCYECYCKIHRVRCGRIRFREKEINNITKKEVQ